MNPDQIAAIEKGVSERMGRPARVTVVKVQVEIDTGLATPGHHLLYAQTGVTPTMLGDSPDAAVSEIVAAVCEVMEDRLREVAA